MDKDFFLKGETVKEFLESLTDLSGKYQEQMIEAQLSEDQTAGLHELPNDLRVMVIAEPWSGDVLYYFPVIVTLAENKGWDVRIFRRDTYPDLILPFRKDGMYHSVPVFVFYDSDFQELGNWVERPEKATRVIDEESLKLRRSLREANKVDWREETINELMELFDS